jgi:hypothetical protein
MGKDKNHEVMEKFFGTGTETESDGKHDGKRKNHEVTGKYYRTGTEWGSDGKT